MRLNYKLVVKILSLAIFTFVLFPKGHAQALDTSGISISPAEQSAGPGSVQVSGTFKGSVETDHCTGAGIGNVVTRGIALVVDTLSYEVYGPSGDTGIGGNLSDREISPGETVYCGTGESEDGAWSPRIYQLTSFNINTSSLGAGTYQVKFSDHEVDDGSCVNYFPGAGAPCPPDPEDHTVVAGSFTILSGSTIRVWSNRATGFVVTGPANFSGNISAGATLSYTEPSGNGYFIQPDTLSGYTYAVTPANPRDLPFGGTIEFDITYTSTGGGGSVSADIKANGSNGPISISSGSSATISWTSSGATSCSVVPTGWTGTSNAGISTGALTSAQTYTLNCTNGSDTDSDQVTVNISGGGGGGGCTGDCFTNISQKINNVTVSNGNSVGSGVTLSPSTTYSASVTLQNSGTTTWSTTSGVEGAYKLGTQNAEDNNTFGLQRVTVPSNTAPGQTATFNFSITTPASGGPYNFEWSMVGQDNWFYQNAQAGNDRYTPNIPVTLSAAAPPIYPTVDSVTISSSSVKADNTTPYTITIKSTYTGSGGAASITDSYVLINFAGPNGGTYRGFMDWSSVNDFFAGDKDMKTCSGLGKAGIRTGGWGEGYIHLDSCTSSNSGNTQTTSYSVRFDPTFTAPTTSNHLAGYAIVTSSVFSGWVDFPGFDLTAAASGTIFVNSNEPTYWSITGGSGPYNQQSPSPKSTSATYDSTTTGSAVSPGSYTMNPSALAGFGGPLITNAGNSADGTTQNLTASSSITFNLTYLSTPTGLDLDTTTQCGQVIATWNDTSDNETGFKIYRTAADAGKGGPYSLLATKAADTQEYTDTTASAGHTYWYYVQAYVTIGGQTLTTNTPAKSAFVLKCQANIDNSQKTITKVNGANYDASVGIHDGDRVTFQITISNSNTATDNAIINNINDVLTDNYAKPTSCTNGGDAGNWCAQVNKGSGFVNTTVTGSVPNITIDVSGALPPGKNWVVQYDSMASVPEGATDLFKNVATINCTSQTSGEDCSTTKDFSFIDINSGANPPQFREVAP
ncbi:MAG TPA: NBR1-Ig-like domain-containing protein [Patescibacteria group bacterium]|nr:NBR1-Ig-like domain-containing protein [Patescibacteria group bacterium]